MGDGIRTEIHVIDRDGDRAKALLAKSSPQLAERFDIRFYTADTETDSFPKVLSDISPDYIIVSLGEEKRNLPRRNEIFHKKIKICPIVTKMRLTNAK